MKNKRESNNLIFVVFVVVLVFFTAVNAYEFVCNKEPDGHMKGLEKLSSVED